MKKHSSGIKPNSKLKLRNGLHLRSTVSCSHVSPNKRCSWKQILSRWLLHLHSHHRFLPSKNSPTSLWRLCGCTKSFSLGAGCSEKIVHGSWHLLEQGPMFSVLFQPKCVLPKVKINICLVLLPANSPSLLDCGVLVKKRCWTVKCWWAARCSACWM